jgi:hypothetical protein
MLQGYFVHFQTANFETMSLFHLLCIMILTATTIIFEYIETLGMPTN